MGAEAQSWPQLRFEPVLVALRVGRLKRKEKKKAGLVKPSRGRDESWHFGKAGNDGAEREK